MNEPLDQLQPTPKAGLSPFVKIVIGNLAVMLLYMTAGGLIIGRNSGGYDMIMLIAQVFLNAFMGLGAVFSGQYRMMGLALLLSSLLAAVIGPGMCSYKQSILPRTEASPQKPI